ncbi:hypothetical protein LCGC14_0098370 [marine sediment metagenome]|uniref:Uncharacterized protein n=1 Tax=marine sediment metagenome TaxID=412755 RepID=A0A0F9YG98_9ZZZZ
MMMKLKQRSELLNTLHSAAQLMTIRVLTLIGS